MEKDKSKLILDSTFAHLEKVLEERRWKRDEKEKMVKNSDYKNRDKKKR